jgi:hypothetical protein
VIRANLFRDSLTVLNEDGVEKEISLSDWYEMIKNQSRNMEEK